LFARKPKMRVMTPAEPESSTLATVIVNFRTPELTAQVVDALLPEIDGIDGQVFVVENDSGDDSFERLTEAARARNWGERAVVVRSDRNGGFGYGINVGVRRALASPRPPRFVYVLNPDAFPEAGAVRALIEVLESDPRIGIAGSNIQDAGSAERAGAFRFPTAFSEFEGTLNLGVVSRVLRRWVVSGTMPTETAEVDWISGASFMVRREVFDAIGLFDDGFFLYFEEIDFCKRARDEGFKNVFVPHSAIRHIGSVSTHMNKNDRPMPEYWFASRRRYFTKHHGHAYAALCDALWIAGFSLARLKRRITGEEDRSKPRMLRDFIRYNVPRSIGRLRL
jgi:N-acetylglucosaminyl-diphospho-decaprenol L-rhamnosyltransferase